MQQVETLEHSTPIRRAPITSNPMRHARRETKQQNLVLPPERSVEHAEILAQPKAVGDLVGKSSVAGEVTITGVGTVG